MPQYQSDPAALARLYVPASRRRAGAARAQSPRIERTHRAARRSTTRTSSRRSPSASIWRPAPRSSERCAPSAAAAARDRHADLGHRQLFGRRRRVHASLRGQPWLILAAVVTIYIVLGVLYESFVHPFTILTTLPSAGIGALLALMLCGHGPVAGGADRHRAADGHRQEERHHDDRLRARGGARRRACRRARRSCRPACCASGRS